MYPMSVFLIVFGGLCLYTIATFIFERENS
jgi:hypothetical protein